MNKEMKKRILSNRDHVEVVEEMNIVNEAAMQLFEQVSLYKYETGKTL